MGDIAKGIGGSLLGGLGGAFANQKEGSTDVGNMFLNKGAGGEAQMQGLRDMQGAGNNMVQDATMGNATSQVGSNDILGQLYGPGGMLSQTVGQEQQQANQGFNLTPEDKDAYGQVSGDIARQFGQSDQSLAQSLSDRGLSSSSVAGAAFTGSQGNKMEQLAKAQTDLAQKRYAQNIQKLGQTRQFLSQLGQGANQAIEGDRSQNIQQGNTLADQATNQLRNISGQANEGLQQRQQTAHGSTLGNIFGGMAQGYAASGGGGGGKSGGGMGGMFAGGGDASSAAMFA